MTFDLPIENAIDPNALYHCQPHHVYFAGGQAHQHPRCEAVRYERAARYLPAGLAEPTGRAAVIRDGKGTVRTRWVNSTTSVYWSPDGGDMPSISWDELPQPIEVLFHGAPA